MAQATVEDRLSKLETELDQLKRSMATLRPSPQWPQVIAGSLEHEPEFDEVLRLGRALRQADRPHDDPSYPG
jgi:hypothetical protein